MYSKIIVNTHINTIAQIREEIYQKQNIPNWFLLLSHIFPIVIMCKSWKMFLDLSFPE